MNVDQKKLDAFVGRFAGDLGAVLHTATVLLGDRLGLYRAMGDSEPVTAQQLARRVALDQRWVREWLSAQAAGGYVDYDASSDRFRLPPEQAFALTDEYNPLFVPGGLQVAAATIKDADALGAALRAGDAFGWDRHDPDLFDGTERFFRPSYIANLVDAWIPALDGVEEMLRSGATVADVGCGYGPSTVLLAQHYPRSRFIGFDAHAPSIDVARKRAADAGVADRTGFAVADATAFPGSGYDLVCFFDCFHDLGDPAGAARHTADALATGGTVLLVEPYAGDRLEDNLTPIGRIFYSVSTTVCTPSSQAQPVAAALGAQAGEARLRAALSAGGLSRVRRAAETPFNLVLEARR